LAAVLLLIISGCDSLSRRMRMRGEVSYAGEPVEDGAILLSPIEGTAGHATGGPIRQGRYDIAAKDAPVGGGTYRVDITGLRLSGRHIKTPEGVMHVRDQYIPAAYNSQSSLRVTISSEASGNEHNFRLAAVRE
jgi:hypothetical protein